MPERERPQKRPQRRGRHHPVPEHVGGAARAQQIAVIDAVRAERHRRHQRHHLRALVARAGALAEIHARIDERLDPQPPGERRRQHDSGVRDRPLIIENDRDAVQSDRPVNMHHEGDLLSQAATAAIGRFSPAQEVILRSRPDGTPAHRRWIEADMDARVKGTSGFRRDCRCSAVCGCRGHGFGDVVDGSWAGVSAAPAGLVAAYWWRGLGGRSGALIDGWSR